MSENYFDIKCDLEIVRTGGFFCCACVVGKPAEEQSPDPRYCYTCYKLLLKEAEMDTRRQGNAWKPINPAPKPIRVGKKTAQVSRDMRTIMSPLENEKTEVDIIQPPTLSGVVMRTGAKSGPKHKQLPQELIIEWASEGMGSKAITTKLKGEHGIHISYKTIQRVLSGERSN